MALFIYHMSHHISSRFLDKWLNCSSKLVNERIAILTVAGFAGGVPVNMP